MNKLMTAFTLLVMTTACGLDRASTPQTGCLQQAEAACGIEDKDCLDAVKSDCEPANVPPATPGGPHS